MRSMVEGPPRHAAVFQRASSAPRLRRGPSTTAFGGGPPPRSGEEF